MLDFLVNKLKIQVAEDTKTIEDFRAYFEANPAWALGDSEKVFFAATRKMYVENVLSQLKNGEKMKDISDLLRNTTITFASHLGNRSTSVTDTLLKEATVTILAKLVRDIDQYNTDK